MKIKNLFFGLSMLVFILSCNTKTTKVKNTPKVEKVNTAFYYWKTKPSSIQNNSAKRLKNCKIQKMYVKFFEVTNDPVDGNIPISKNNLSKSSNTDFSIIPCIYIHNNVFLKSDKNELDKLADNINFLIDKKRKDKFPTMASFNEIQIDCDWTKTTKDNYFYFLKKLKELSKKEISCTLRLYPYKYPEIMGIPPVDKAMLMCYNLTNPLTDRDKNSILDINELDKYLVVKEKYPKHLDIALPIYSWMQVFHNNQFTKVIYEDFDEIKKGLKPIKPLWFEVIKDISIPNTYLRIGNKIKYDEISLQTITKAIEIIKENVHLNKEITVSFFHLDQEQLKNFSDEEITNLYRLFTE